MQKIVGIKLPNHPKIQFYKALDFSLKKGDAVIVEIDGTIEYGLVKVSPIEYEDNEVSSTVKEIIRLATQKDQDQKKKNDKESLAALKDAKQMATELKLSMQFIDANYTFDRNQLFFTYLAEQRVDFRQLAKRLASKYKTRIELRQIGVRDKAMKVGGLGPCGLVLCCNQFLKDFAPVSINMAKNQDLALNPTKINGLCGRLLCCLNYEDELYRDLKKKFPEINSTVETKEGKGKVIAIHLLKGTYEVQLNNNDIVVMNV